MTTRNIRYGLVAALTLAVGTLASIAQAEENSKVSPAEKAVRNVVSQHIQGIVNADAKTLQSVWDESGRITFVTQNDEGKEVVHEGPIADSIKLWTAKKINGTKGSIQSVDIVHDKMALAKAQITWQGKVFDDYLVLLKTDGDWRLVSKTYTSRRSGGFLYGSFSFSP